MRLARVSRCCLAPLVLGLALVAPLTLHAQGRASTREAPVDAARRWFAATQSFGWRDAAALVDPAQRPQVRGWLVEQVQMAELMREQVSAQMREQMRAQMRGARDTMHVVGMIVSDEVEEAHGATMTDLSSLGSPDSATMRRLRAMALPAFEGSPTLGELLALPDEALVARMLEAGRSPVTPDEGPDSVDGRRRWTLEEVLDRIDPSEVRPIGAVIEADSIAHVVYRVKWPESGGMIEGRGGPPVQTLELRRRAGRWYVRLTTDDTDGILQGMMMHYMRLEPGAH